MVEWSKADGCNPENREFESHHLLNFKKNTIYIKELYMKTIRTIIKEEIDKFVNELNTDGLPDIGLKSNAPQIDRRGRYSADVEDDRVIVMDNNFEPNTLYDFIIDQEGNLRIGGGHYKLAKRAGNIKGAGEIKINDQGKVNYINNESGHYEPTKEELDAIASKFRELKIASDDMTVDRRY